MNDRPTEQAVDRPTDAPILESTEEVAARLGVSRNAILQRIKRGTLAGHKVDGVWWVIVDEQYIEATTDEEPTDRPSSRPITRSYDRPTEQAAVVELQAGIETRYNDTIQTLRESFDIQLSSQRQAFEGWLGEKDAVIAAKDETIDELRRRAEAAESRVSDLEMQRAESPDKPTSPPETRPQRTWWQFWKQA